jgi:hypothetical protein
VPEWVTIVPAPTVRSVLRSRNMLIPSVASHSSTAQDVTAASQAAIAVALRAWYAFWGFTEVIAARPSVPARRPRR